ncbi:ATP-binding response regulator [Oceanobacter mangrovi]|uniref:ATP-binding response regulator n=1 Tax=Oceanobacter mangrovi TaxID=2862510 RepID=UPI001C8F1990|nr:hybrid sensor histidine kinase/response regulator [Oceanobacter mangrovi]
MSLRSAADKRSKPTFDSEVEAEKIRIVQRNTPLILLGNLFGSMPLLIIFWEQRHANSVLLWEGALVALLALRLLHFLWHKPQLAEAAGTDELRGYDRQQMLLILLTGFIWGAAGWHFFDANEIKNVSFLILTFVSMIAGSLVSLSSRPLSYMLFAAALMTPLIARMVLAQEEFYNWMGFGATVYLLATFGFSRTIHRVMDRSIQLQYENLDLIEDLRQQTERANAASLEKSRFFAAASHDLRQPLQAIGLYSESLAGQLNTVEQHKGLRNIQQGVDSLHELLDALFDVSRLDSGIVTVSRQNFRLDDIIGKLESQFALEARLKGLDFQLACNNLTVDSDPVLLERVLTNLLVNAFRYTDRGGVTVDTELLDNQLVQLHIRDTGVGISSDDLKRIFDEFFQVHNPERDRRHGLGLGLAIVRRIMAMLDHPLDVQSSPGLGTTFTLTLPLAASLPQPVVADRGISLTEDIFTGLKVLVVDNEMVIVDAMKELLHSWGSICHGFISSGAALEAIEQGLQPDLLLVDYRMPGIANGCDLVAQIHQHLPQLPALIITGDTSPEVVEEISSRKLGFMHKPIKPARLRIKASRMLAKYQTEASSR